MSDTDKVTKGADGSRAVAASGWGASTLALSETDHHKAQERLRAGDYRDSTGREYRAQPAPAHSERSQPVGPVALDALCLADADPSVNPYREVRDALEARLAFGAAKYGTALTTHNGRDALRDALEEALDGMQYAQQLNLEARDEEAHDAALWAEDARRMFAAAARSLLWAERARARGGR